MKKKEQKNMRATIRVLKKEGKLPPDKARLNRKKFIEETKTAWNCRSGVFMWEFRLMAAFLYVLQRTEGLSGRASLEAVGAAKVLAIALRLEEFHQKMKAENRSEYKISEEYEFIKDILNA